MIQNSLAPLLQADKRQMEQQQRLAQEQQRLIQEQQRLAQEQHLQATAREDALRAALQTERDTNAENQKKMNDQTVQHLQLSVAHEQEKAVTDKARVEEAAAITRQLLSEKDSKFASVTSEQAARIADLKEQRETQAAQTAINQFQHQQAMLNQQQFALNLSTTLLTCSSGRPISTQPTADQPSADIISHNGTWPCSLANSSSMDCMPWRPKYSRKT